MIHADAPVIHHLAHCDEDVSIGARTLVWQFASIIRGARIGEDCNIASAAIIDGSIIGNRCTIGHGASVHPGTKLGDDVFVGPAVIFCNDLWPRVSKDGFDLGWLLAGGVAVLVEDGASIGAGAVVLPGVVIGKEAMIAAGSVVSQNVPANHVYKSVGMQPIDPGRSVRRVRQAVA